MQITQLKKGEQANQWGADPRQQLFISYYMDPKSATFSNALQSALKAGYAQEYAESILSLMPDWLSEKLGKIRTSGLLEKAERNLDEILDLPSKIQAIGAFGPLFKKKSKRVKEKGKIVTKKVDTDEPIMVHATGLLKVKADVTKFVAERVGKKKYGLDTEGGGEKILIINISGQSNQRYGTNKSSGTNSN